MYHVWIASPDGSNQRYHSGFRSPNEAITSAAKVLRGLGGLEATVRNIPEIGIRMGCPNLPFILVVRNAFIREDDGSLMRETMVSDLTESDPPLRMDQIN
jgi:hypothetical protein